MAMSKNELAKMLGIKGGKEPRIEFVKLDFRPEKTKVVPIFERMYNNSDFKKEINRINNDIKTAFTNILKMGVTKQEIPMLSASLFNQLMVTIDSANTEYLDGQSAPEWTQKELKKIAETQYKMYKVLAKIEADLIDEQNTDIKDNKKPKKVSKYSKDAESKTNKDIDKLFDELKALKEEVNGIKEDYDEFKEDVENGVYSGDDEGGLLDVLTDDLTDNRITRWYKGSLFGRDPRLKNRRLRQRYNRYKKYLADKHKGGGGKNTKPTKPESPKNTKPESPKNQKPTKPESPKNQKPTKPESPKNQKPTPPDTDKGGPNKKKSWLDFIKIPKKKPEWVNQKVWDFAKKIGQHLKKLEKFAGKVMRFFGTVFAFIEVFIVLPKTIYDYWKICEEEHPEYSIIEKVVYSIFAGLTTWVMKFLFDIITSPGLLGMLIKWIAPLIIGWIKEIPAFFCLAVILSWVSDGLVYILEKIVVPCATVIFGFIQKHTAAGRKAGEYAVTAYQDFSEGLYNFCKGCIPNAETLGIMFGYNKDIEELKRSGYYEYNAMGTSKLNNLGGANDIARKLTPSQIRALLKHDDVDADTKKSLRDALKIQMEQGITDIDVKKANNISPRLDYIKGVLYKDPEDFQKEWYKIVVSALEWAKTNNGLERVGWIQLQIDNEGNNVTRTPLHILPSLLGWMEDADDFKEGFFGELFDEYDAKTFAVPSGITHGKEFCLTFTVFGTIIGAYTNNAPASNKCINVDPKTTWKCWVIGCLELNGTFSPKKVAPDDVVFDYLKKSGDHNRSVPISGLPFFCNLELEEPIKAVGSGNKVSTGDVQKLTEGSTPSQLPAHLAMTAGTGEISGNYTPGALPTHLAGTTGVGTSGGTTLFNDTSSSGPTSDMNIPVKKVTASEASRTVWNFLKNKLNLTDEQAAGIMGNLDVESGGFGKNMYKVHWDRNGPSGGICQWHDKTSTLGRDRLTALLKFAGWSGEQISAFYNKIKANNWKGDLPIDLETQLAFLVHEIKTTHKSTLNGGTWKEVQYTGVLKATDVRQAAESWVRGFEKPGNAAQQVIERTAKGKGWLKEYGGGKGTEGSTDNGSSQDTQTASATASATVVPDTAGSAPPPGYAGSYSPNAGDPPISATGNNGEQAPGNSSENILELARKMISGTVYSQPKRTQEGYYDCSSFVSEVLRKSGGKVKGYPSTGEIADTLKANGYQYIGGASARNQKGVQPGDILLKRKHGKKSGHVMFYAGNGKVIEANGYNGNHNGINRWGALHAKSDIYEVWRRGGGSIPPLDDTSTSSEVISNASYTEYSSAGDAVNEIFQPAPEPLNIPASGNMSITPKASPSAKSGNSENEWEIESLFDVFVGDLLPSG